jgi:hypothetical protein
VGVGNLKAFRSRLAGWYGVDTETASGNADLEWRRAAIVRALRGETGPPSPAGGVGDASVQNDRTERTDRIERIERAVEAVRCAVVDLSDRMAALIDQRGGGSAYLAAGGDHLDAVDGEEPVETPRIPPLQPGATLSSRASEALFGY